MRKTSKSMVSVIMVFTMLCSLFSVSAFAADSSEFTYSSVPAYSGSAYAVVNDNQPYFKESDFTTESYESYSDLDSLGRAGVAMASLCTDTMPAEDEERGDISSIYPTGMKGNNNSYKGVDGGWIYNRCHLIGWQLSAENANEKNLITGTRYMNVTGMLPFENMVADYIEETGNHVLYRVTPVFLNNDLVCRGVLMEAQSVEDDGEGIQYCVFCYNVQDGITIDYATGENSDSGHVYVDNYCEVCGAVETLSTPVISNISNTTTGMKIAWGAVSHAAKYGVYCKAGTGSWKQIGTTTSTSYTNKSVTSGTTYAYKVVCLTKDGATKISSLSSAKELVYLAPVLSSDLTLSNVSNGVKVTWKTVKGATGYYVYRKTGSSGSYSRIATISSGSTVTYTDTSAANGKTYYYCVRAFINKGATLGGYSGKVRVYLTRPTISSATSGAYGKMTVKWNKNSSATGYQICYSTSSSFSSSKTVNVTSNSTVSKTLSSLSAGKKYYVKMRSYKTDSNGANAYSAWSASKSVSISNYVYITSSGKKYHSTSTCSNMKSPQKVTISTAKSKGKTACSKCW